MKWPKRHQHLSLHTTMLSTSSQSTFRVCSPKRHQHLSFHTTMLSPSSESTFRVCSPKRHRLFVVFFSLSLSLFFPRLIFILYIFFRCYLTKTQSRLKQVQCTLAKTLTLVRNKKSLNSSYCHQTQFIHTEGITILLNRERKKKKKSPRHSCSFEFFVVVIAVVVVVSLLCFVSLLLTATQSSSQTALFLSFSSVLSSSTFVH